MWDPKAECSKSCAFSSLSHHYKKKKKIIMKSMCYLLTGKNIDWLKISSSTSQLTLLPLCVLLLPICNASKFGIVALNSTTQIFNCPTPSTYTSGVELPHKNNCVPILLQHNLLFYILTSFLILFKLVDY